MSAVAAATLAVFAAPAMAEDALRIGVEGAYPPFSSKNPDSSLFGFDIEIAMALCAEMKRECELVEQEWDGMIPALKARKFDGIVASMSITEKRKRQIDFTEKYYQTPARLVAPKDADFDATPESLAGMERSIELLKTTTLVSTIAYTDLMYQANDIAQRTFRPLEVYTVVAVIYFVVIFGFDT